MGHGIAMANLFARRFVLFTSSHCVNVTACRANCALYVGLVSIGTLGDIFILVLTLGLGLTLDKGLDLMYPLGRVPTWSMGVIWGFYPCDPVCRTNMKTLQNLHRRQRQNPYIAPKQKDHPCHRLIEHPVNGGIHVIWPHEIRQPLTALECIPEIVSHNLDVIVVRCQHMSEVFERVNPLELHIARRKDNVQGVGWSYPGFSLNFPFRPHPTHLGCLIRRCHSYLVHLYPTADTLGVDPFPRYVYQVHMVTIQWMCGGNMGRGVCWWCIWSQFIPESHCILTQFPKHQVWAVVLTFHIIPKPRIQFNCQKAQMSSQPFDGRASYAT